MTTRIQKIYADGVLVEREVAVVEPTPEQITARAARAKKDLVSYAAAARWRKETGGFTVNGMRVETDDRSKLLIFAARTKAKEDAETTKRWKTDAGFITLDAATLIAIGDAVEAHVTACFDLEDDVVAQIESGTITTREQVDAAFA